MPARTGEKYFIQEKDEHLKLIVFHNVHIEIDVVQYICILSCLFKSVVVKVFLGKL